MKKFMTLDFALRLIVAIILVQTLFFKFTGAEESKYIFSTLGMEPWGRIGSGIVELFAAIFILIPKTIWLGALMAIGTVTGALFFHLTKLGIVVMNDGGLLFILACIVFICSLFLLFKHRAEIPIVGKRLAAEQHNVV